MENKILLDDKQLRTIYVGGLSAFVTEQQFFELFSPLGKIQEMMLMRSKHDGSCLGYGFLTFATYEEALRTMETMNGKMFLGKQLNINWASRKNVGDHKHNHQHDLHGAELHFSFVSKQVRYHTLHFYSCNKLLQNYFLVTEATVRNVFQEFGPVQDIFIRKSSFDKKGHQNGYGFVHYPLTNEGIASATRACKLIRHLSVEKVLYDCTPTHTFQRLLNTLNTEPDNGTITHSSTASSSSMVLFNQSPSNHQIPVPFLSVPRPINHLAQQQCRSSYLYHSSSGPSASPPYSKTSFR